MTADLNISMQLKHQKITFMKMMEVLKEKKVKSLKEIKEKINKKKLEEVNKSLKEHQKIQEKNKHMNFSTPEN